MNLLKFETGLMRSIYDAGFEQAATGAVWSNAVEEQSLWRGLFRKQVPQAVSAGTGLMVRDEKPLDVAPLEP